jgi:hypothetical protein
MAGQHVIHMAPPASRVPVLMADLFDWLVRTDAHPLIVSSVFHYEFEFIHPFADGNGRLGRMWQSLILSKWNPLFGDFPVFEHQSAYYLALEESTRQADSAPFITFMLGMILDTFKTATLDTGAGLTPDVTPHATPDATPYVRLLPLLVGEMTRQQLREAIGLRDDEHFRRAYLIPALEAGLIEMTIPEKPRSSRQKYRLTAKGRQVLATG